MSDPHPADADYSAFNEPNMEELDVQIDAALALAGILQGSGRRFKPIPRESAPIRVAIDDGTDPSTVTVFDPPIRRPDPVEVYAAARAAAVAAPAQLSDDESMVVRHVAETFERHILSLREMEADNDVLDKALTTLELGCLGLRRVSGHNESVTTG